MNNVPKDRRLLSAGGGGATAARAGSRGPSSIPRSRFTISSDFVLPKSGTVTQLPLSVTSMQESDDVTLQGNGRILINTSGLYRVILGVDWVAQNDTDVDRRMIGIRRWPGSLPNQDDRLASVDIPGSSPPHTATEDLAAGQLIYAVVRSRMTGDYVQATCTTFLQIERFA